MEVLVFPVPRSVCIYFLQTGRGSRASVVVLRTPPPKCVFSSGFRVVSSFVVDCFCFPSQQTQPKNQIRTSSCKAVRCALLSISGPVFPFLVLLAAFLRSRCHLTAQYTVSLVSVTSPLSYSLDFSALLNPGRCQCSL